MINKSKGNSPIKSVNPSQLPEFVDIGIGGVAGAGKTHLLGTIGKGKKMLVFDTEGGNATYRGKAFLDDPNSTEPNNIDIVTFDDVSDPKGMIHVVESAFDYLIRTRNSDGYSLVALDSLTEFQARFLELHSSNDPRQSYGAFNDSLHTIVRKAKQIPTNTVFTARLRHVNDEVLGREIVRFGIAPGAWEVVSGLFDLIGFFSIRTQGARTIRELDFNHTTRTPGKTRGNVGKLTDPNLVSLFKQLKDDGGGKEQSKQTQGITATKAA